MNKYLQCYKHKKRKIFIQKIILMITIEVTARRNASSKYWTNKANIVLCTNKIIVAIN